MADVPKGPERPLQRICECHRFEDQLLALAYQAIWPVLRKQTSTKGATTTKKSVARLEAKSRRA
jgi:hypothetical protein